MNPGNNRKTYLYYILLIGTVIILSSMMVIERGIKNRDGKYGRKKALNNNPPSGEAINELLLSADELTITEKKAFISLYLKADDGDVAYKQIKSQRNDMYSRILNRKLNNVKRSGSKPDDFSIKAIPK